LIPFFFKLAKLVKSIYRLIYQINFILPIVTPLTR
jgi:hypothetical protein